MRFHAWGYYNFFVVLSEPLVVPWTIQRITVVSGYIYIYKCTYIHTHVYYMCVYIYVYVVTTVIVGCHGMTWLYLLLMIRAKLALDAQLVEVNRTWRTVLYLYYVLASTPSDDETVHKVVLLPCCNSSNAPYLQATATRCGGRAFNDVSPVRSKPLVNLTRFTDCRSENPV